MPVRTLAAVAITAVLVLLPTAAHAGSDAVAVGTGHPDRSAGQASTALATDRAVGSTPLGAEVVSDVPAGSFVVGGLAVLVAGTALLVLVDRRDDDETEG